MQLSAHFTLEELVFSQAALRTGIDNTPNAAEQQHLVEVCQNLLEPVRALLGIPLHVDSGFRCPTLNTLIGGATDSAHLDGRAADVIPVGKDLRECFDAIAASQIPFDQLIIECNAWLHLGLPAPGVAPRRQLLIASGTPGHWTYSTP